MKQVILDQVTIEAGGNVNARLRKLFVDDDTDEVIASTPHRFVVEAGADVDVVIASVTQHLTSAGYPEPPTGLRAAILAMRAAA